jgi:hypothetical protein
LTAGVPDLDDDESITFKTLTLNIAATQALTITTGELRVLGTGVVTPLGGTGLGNLATITVPTAGALVLEQGGILQLPAFSVVEIDDTTITGSGSPGGTANAVRLTTLGGEVKLTPNYITGSGSTLQVTEDFEPPAITAAGLHLVGANLDLQFGGSLTLAVTNTVVLESGANPGKLTLSEENTPYVGTATAPATLNGRLINSGAAAANNALLSGTGALLGDDAEELPSTIGVLSGTLRGTLPITGQGAGSTIVAGNSVIVVP